MDEFLIEHADVLVTELGDCPNIELDTLGGAVFWQDLKQKNGMKLQKQLVSGHCRILNRANKRIAWGSETVMREKFRRLTGKSFLEPGDIIGVTRKRAMNLYDHYAVYLGEEQVIHYAGSHGDFSEDPVIHQAHIREFMKKDDNFFVLFFEDNRHAPKKIFYRSKLSTTDNIYKNQIIYSHDEPFTLYSAKETIARAKSRLDENAYNLVTNNCEHFALWCKTGVSTSFQVKLLQSEISESLAKIATKLTIFV